MRWDLSPTTVIDWVNLGKPPNFPVSWFSDPSGRGNNHLFLIRVL